jgi:hypothetical protein
MVKQRLWLSLACGVALNLLFFTLSVAVVRVLPYEDKPRMPNAFTWLLVPGLLAGEQFDQHHILA